MVFLHLTAAYLRFNNRAKLRPDPSVEMRLTSDAMSQMASLLRVKLVAMEVTVMFPSRKPSWLSGIGHLLPTNEERPRSSCYHT